MKRRTFLGGLSGGLGTLGLGALGASALGASLRSGALPPGLRAFGPSKAAAQPPDDGGTLFLEICLRDQWDQMHVFVPPGIASFGRVHRGETGDGLTFFAQPDELRTAPTSTGNVFLTADSYELAPFVDTVAQVDFGEPTAGDIHGHEAANPIRTPGRRRERLPGYMSLFENDPASSSGGNMEDYGTVPTPACVHNHWSKSLDPSLRNGIAFKGISRSNHTVYHFAAGLPGGELDRVRSRGELFDLFPPFVDDPSLVRSAVEADAIQRALGRVDDRFLARRRIQARVRDDHQRQIDELRQQLHVAEPRVVSLPLTDEERAYWGSGVPSQTCTRDDRESFECGEGQVKAQIWEQVAYAYKLLSAGLTRTVALEFDWKGTPGSESSWWTCEASATWICTVIGRSPRCARRPNSSPSPSRASSRACRRTASTSAPSSPSTPRTEAAPHTPTATATTARTPSSSQAVASAAATTATSASATRATATASPTTRPERTARP